MSGNMKEKYFYYFIRIHNIVIYNNVFHIINISKHIDKLSIDTEGTLIRDICVTDSRNE